MKDSFLKEILGSDGYMAIKKAISTNPSLNDILIPRCVSSWINCNLDKNNYSFVLPNTNVYVELIKNENNYDGRISSIENDYSFTDKDIVHIVAGTLVLMGNPVNTSNYNSKSLMLLSKSIDMLVKNNLIKKENLQKSVRKDFAIMNNIRKKSFKKAGDNFGPSDGQVPPSPPTAPTATASPKPKEKGTIPTGTPKMAKPAQPVASHTLKLSENEAQRECGICGLKNIKNNAFVGCMCFRDLAKHVVLIKDKTNFVLQLDEEWDMETIVTFKESVRNGK